MLRRMRRSAWLFVVVHLALVKIALAGSGPAPILNGQTPGNQAVTGRITAIAASPTDANTIYVAATNTDSNSQTTTASTTAAANGSFSLSVPITGGLNVLNVIAVSPSGGTAHTTRTVEFDFVPGTILLD